MRLFKLPYIWLVFGVLLTTGCYYDNEEELFPDNGSCNLENVTFSQTIQPILEARCFSCHEDGLAGGGIIFATYDGVKIYVDNGKLMGSIRQNPGFSPMPKDSPKIPNCEILQIERWISEGASNN